MQAHLALQNCFSCYQSIYRIWDRSGVDSMSSNRRFSSQSLSPHSTGAAIQTRLDNVPNICNKRSKCSTNLQLTWENTTYTTSLIFPWPWKWVKVTETGINVQNLLEVSHWVANVSLTQHPRKHQHQGFGKAGNVSFFVSVSNHHAKFERVHLNILPWWGTADPKFMANFACQIEKLS